MSDAVWPSNIKPLTNRNYATSRGGNVLDTPVAGGLPRINLNNTLESPVFQLNFSLSRIGFQVIMNFYDVAINHGANSFKMNLDSGNGIEEHQCYIVPNTWRVTRPSHNVWLLSCSMIAEVTSSQLDEVDWSYLYPIYGEDIALMTNLFENWVESFPNG